MHNDSSFPTFLIVGAAKSGTTTLHQLLKDHPQIYMPERKELNFWYTHGRDDWAILQRFPDLPRSLDDYLSYFETDKVVRGEASPGYLAYYKETIDNLQQLHPQAKQVKIIMILREPIAKIWSHYKMVERANMDPDGLSLKASLAQEAHRKQQARYLLDVLPVFGTDYLAQVEAYLTHFEQVKILLFEDLKKRPQQLLDELTTFLEVAPMQHPNPHKKHNAAPKKTIQYHPFFEALRKIGLNKLVPTGLKEVRRKRLRRLQQEAPMEEEVRAQLAAHYKPEIIQLQELTGLDLSHWLAQYR